MSTDKIPLGQVISGLVLFATVYFLRTDLEKAVTDYYLGKYKDEREQLKAVVKNKDTADDSDEDKEDFRVVETAEDVYDLFSQESELLLDVISDGLISVMKEIRAIALPSEYHKGTYDVPNDWTNNHDCFRYKYTDPSNLKRIDKLLNDKMNYVTQKMAVRMNQIGLISNKT